MENKEELPQEFVDCLDPQDRPKHNEEIKVSIDKKMNEEYKIEEAPKEKTYQFDET